MMKREFDENGYDQSGFDRNNIHRDTGTRFNSRGYDFEGYDENGRNVFGLDRDGYGVDGRDYQGYDRNGFNKEGVHKVTFRDYDWNGFKQDGTHITTGTPYDTDGYDRSGLNRDGVSRDGTSTVKIDTFDGPRTISLKTPKQIHQMSDAELGDYQKQIRDAVEDTDLFADDGNLDRVYQAMAQASAETLYRQDRLPDGYMHVYGGTLINNCYADARYDDKRPRDDEGYDWDGFDKYGFHRETGGLYSPDGYDAGGFDKDGLDYDGYDADGFDKDGYDWEGYNADGFDRYGNHRDGSKHFFDAADRIQKKLDGMDPMDDTYPYWTEQRRILAEEGRKWKQVEDAKAGDPLAGNEPLWSSDNGFSGNGEPSGLIATRDEKGGWHKAVQGGKKALSNLFGSAKSATEAAKTGDIEVSGYTYIRNGKQVHVDGYTRKRSK